MWLSTAGILVAWFAVMAVAERLRPRRKTGRRTGVRLVNNICLGLLNTILLRFGVPFSAIGIAAWAGTQGLGLQNGIGLSGPLEILTSFVMLDLAVWFQHVLSHRLAWFWRLHRVHHLDMEFDVSTAVRFHPVEILVSLVYKSIVIIVLGASPLAVLIFEILLAAGAMFNHANLNLPASVDRTLRRLVVTPDMHRVHHSVVREEHDTNYGFFLSTWDRLFSTYRSQPRKPHESMPLGLSFLRDPDRAARADYMLIEPLVTRNHPHG